MLITLWVSNHNWISIACKVQLEFILTFLFFPLDMTRLAVFMYERGEGLECIFFFFWCHELVYFISHSVVEGPLIPWEGMALQQLLKGFFTANNFFVFFKQFFNFLLTLVLWCIQDFDVFFFFVSASFYIIVF